MIRALAAATSLNTGFQKTSSSQRSPDEPTGRATHWGYLLVTNCSNCSGISRRPPICQRDDRCRGRDALPADCRLPTEAAALAIGGPEPIS